MLDSNNKTENKIMNIYQRLNKVKEATGYLQKDAHIPGKDGGYRALSHDKVTSETREHFIEWGVMVTISLESGHTFDAGATKYGALQRIYEGVYSCKFINIDDPKDFLEVKIPAQGLDQHDKGVGKSISMAMKYGILKVLQIPSGDEEEARDEEVYPVKKEQGQVDETKVLEDLIKQTNTDLEAALKFYEVKSLKAMNEKQRGHFENKLRERLQ